MAYAQNLAKLVFGGGLFGDVEDWASSLTLQDPTGNAPRPEPATVAPALAAWMGRTESCISQYASLVWVKLNRIGTDGRYLSRTDTFMHEFSAPFPKGNRTGWYPPQLTLAHTLRTDAKRGRAHIGRFYPPLPVPVHQATDGRIVSDTAQAMADSAGQLLRSINQLLGPWRVVVASGLDASVRPVIQVSVGTVMDTQRRRRSHIAETYAHNDVDVVAGAVDPI